MEFSITLPATQQTMPLRTLLESEWLVPRKVRHFLRVRKNVTVNQAPAFFHDEVKAGDVITIILEEDDYQHQVILLGDANQLTVLYEDEHLLIVNKPVGIKTHPNQPTERDTLLNQAAAYLASEGSRPYVVHRLDKETSGVVLFAKNPLVLPILGRLLEEKKIYRQYQAIVHGRLSHSQTITKKIGRDRHDRRKRVIDEKNGQTAVTHLQVEKHQGQQSFVTCILETGRTHQIRVHLASIGHPIVGDPLYQKQSAPRLMLHAVEMHVTHPFTKEELTIVSHDSLW